MSSLINFFKSLFGGIFSFIGGLFGGKKSATTEGGNTPKVRRSSGYFLELDEAQSIKPVASAPAVETPAPSPAAAEPAKVEAVAAPKPEPVVQNGATPAPVKVAEPVAAPAAPAIANFATTYLIPAADTNGRRRPGANMNYFLGLARQVNPSNN